MTTPNIDVKPVQATPQALGASSTPTTTPASVPTKPVGGGQRPSDAVPYDRYKAQLDTNKELADKVDTLTRLVMQPKPPVNLQQPANIPDPEQDPLGYLTHEVQTIKQSLAAQEGRARVQDGDRLLDKIKTDYPIFTDPKIGTDALDVLSAKLNHPDVRQNIIPASRVVREVAERYSQYKVATNNGLPEIKQAQATETSSLPGGSPEAGALKPEPFKGKTFEEYAKAAKPRWGNLAQKMAGNLQI